MKVRSSRGAPFCLHKTPNVDKNAVIHSKKKPNETSCIKNSANLTTFAVNK